MTSTKHGASVITIVGGGFSGLVTAYYLTKKGCKVRVLERAPRPGGMIETKITEFGLVETAANAFLNSAALEEMMSDLQLSIEVPQRIARRRYVYRREQTKIIGAPRRWPLTWRGTLQTLKFSFQALGGLKAARPTDRESVRKWSERVLGFEGSRYLAEAAMQGIYAGDPEQLSARLIFGKYLLPRSEKKAESVAMPRVKGSVSVSGGMGVFISRLQDKLVEHGVEFQFGVEVTPEMVDEMAGRVVIATSAHQASGLLNHRSQRLSQLLARVEMVPLISATVFFKDSDIHSRGFGCLFPPIENRLALGVLKNNFIFYDRVQSGYSETWILGGAMPSRRDAIQKLFDAKDEEIVRLICQERSEIFHLATKLPDDVLDFCITRWPKAIPHYTIELAEIIPEIVQGERGVYLIGNYLGEIGLAKILEQAMRLAHEIVGESTGQVGELVGEQAPVRAPSHKSEKAQ